MEFDDGGWDGGEVVGRGGCYRSDGDKKAGNYLVIVEWDDGVERVELLYIEWYRPQGPLILPLLRSLIISDQSHTVCVE